MADKPRLTRARVKPLVELEQFACCQMTRHTLSLGAGELEVLVDLDSIRKAEGAKCRWCSKSLPDVQMVKIVKILAGPKIEHDYIVLGVLDIDEAPLLESLPMT